MVIEKNKVNKCIFTLSERTTLSPVYYLFKFDCVQDNGTTSVVFLSEDTSINKLRCNEFLIEETELVDLSIGKINLTEGDWTYTIYEQSSSSNLDVAFAGSIVEIGRVDVIGASEETASFSSTSNIKVFE